MLLRKAIALPAAVTIAALAGCDGSSSITAPGGGDGSSGGTASFSQSISVDDLEDETSSGTARVEIELRSGGLVAREIEVEEDDEQGDEEKIEARVTAIQASGDGGTVTFDVGGGLQVTFDGSTDFEANAGEADDDLTLSEFVDRVQAELDAGRSPFVEAKRNPASEPQAPDDATFLARELEIEDDEDDGPEIEMNVDADNFERNGSPPPEAWLTVLGLRIEIVDGVTELRRENDDDRDEGEFEAGVASVDVAAGEVTLSGGTVVRVVEGTEIDGEDDGDDDGDDEELGSLQEVADALAAGRPVKAEGEGLLESRDPRVLVAIEIEFEVDDDGDDDGDLPAGAFEFENDVESVDVGASSFTLASGTEVQMTGETTIESDGDLLTLQAAADAVADGRLVRAEGDAESTSTSGVWTALSVKFEVDD